MTIVIVGLSITSSWGNGHATTYRALARALASRGHEVLFLERDVPWYAAHRDLPAASYCRIALYEQPRDLDERFAGDIGGADLVVVGSYVPDGVAIIDTVRRLARGCLAFYDIDTPITLASLVSGGAEYLERRQVTAFDLYLSFAGGPTLHRLEREFGARRARALYCSVDPDAYQPSDAVPAYDLTYLGTYSADRQPTLDRLLLDAARAWPAGSFVVAGPQYPEDLRFPENVERLDHVDPAAHAAFYGRSRFTLNVTRRDMVAAGYSPSVRLFEAAACGVPIISDAWPGIDTVLEPGVEVLIADRTSQVIQWIRELPDAERRAIGHRARARVLAAHTSTHRAVELERYVAEARRGGEATSPLPPAMERTA